MDDAFYTRGDDDSSRNEQSDGTFIPSQATIGPWDSGLQHGSPVASLLATRLERAAGVGGGMRVAHFALEFLGPVPAAPMKVETSVVRPGKKISFHQATASVGPSGPDGASRVVVRASAWVISTSEGRHSPVRIDEPLPPIPAKAAETYFESVPRFGYGDALEWRFAEGGFVELGPSTVWTRLRVAIVRGEPVSPLARLLAMVDSANGLSAELDLGRYLFVPVNLTVSLARHPETEWVGMRSVTSLAGDGGGITRAHLFDERGLLGEALQTLYVEAR